MIKNARFGSRRQIETPFKLSGITPPKEEKLRKLKKGINKAITSPAAVLFLVTGSYITFPTIKASVKDKLKKFKRKLYSAALVMIKILGG